MKPKLKKELISWSIIGVVALGLYLTGTHTTLISWLQRGILSTGLIKPDTEQTVAISTHNTEYQLELQLKDAAGNTVTMNDLAGKVIFLNIWATWCPPCQAEMPGINKLYQQMAEEDSMAFVMLSVDKNFETALRHVEEKGYDFPIYQLNGRLPKELNASALPTTFVLDKSGKIVLQHKGMAAFNNADFRQFLKELLQQQPSDI